MNVIGLDEVTDARAVFGKTSPVVFARDAMRSVLGEIRVRPWQAIGAIAIAFAPALVGAPPGEPHGQGPPLAVDAQGGFTPLSAAIMDEAWTGAVEALRRENTNVPALIAQASERVNAWRSTPLAAHPAEDDSDET